METKTMKTFKKAEFNCDNKEKQKLINDIRKCRPDMTQAEIDTIIKESLEKRVYLNDKYQVAVHEINPPHWPSMFWLSIRRIDREAIHDWRDMQEIKNQIIGTEFEGFELYPAEERCVDTANQYHMFVFKDSGIRIPVGFFEGVQDDKTIGQSKQRKFQEENTNTEKWCTN